MKFKVYTKEIANEIDGKYNDLVENIYANDVAWDLSCGISPDKVWFDRSGGIIRYYRGNTDKAREIFKEIVNLMRDKN